MSFDAAFARRAREAVTPPDCKPGLGCWVDDGTLASVTFTSAPRCRRCHGYIEHPPHSPWRHRPKDHGRAEP